MSNRDLLLFCLWTFAVAAGFYTLGVRIGRLAERDERWQGGSHEN